MENLKKHRQELLEEESKWEKLQKELLEGFKNKYGVLMPSISLQSLGVDRYYEIHEKKIRQLENEIKNEYIRALSVIANSIAKENKKPPLIDYGVPFMFIEDTEDKGIQPTKDEKIIFYFLTKPVNTFRGLQSIILSEPGFFNQADVIVEKGKATYKSTIRNTKANLQYYNIFDKKGNITIVGKGVKNIFEKLLAEDKIRLNYNDPKFKLNHLKSLIRDFFKFDDTENLEAYLIKLDGESNLENNLMLIRDLYPKLESDY
jgi:hypothetical protein